MRFILRWKPSVVPSLLLNRRMAAIVLGERAVKLESRPLPEAPLVGIPFKPFSAQTLKNVAQRLQEKTSASSDPVIVIYADRKASM